MALPDKTNWKACISYFAKNKKDKANLGVIISRAKEYIKSGKVCRALRANSSNRKEVRLQS